MEKLNQLTVNSGNPDFCKVLFGGGFAHATNSFYGVRHPSDQLNEKGLEDGLAVNLSQFFVGEPAILGTTNIDIFNDVPVQDKTERCDVCNGHGEVEREFEGYYKTDDCPKCDGMRSNGYDPLEYVYVNVSGKYISGKHLHKILSVFEEVEYGILGELFYFRSGEYEGVIQPTSDMSGVTNIRIIDL